MKASNAMTSDDVHTCKRSQRGIIAIILTTLYLMITLAPFISLTMHSSTVAHALTGQCTGDCNSCGCSPESRAARTCCCSKNNQMQALVHEAEHENKPDCCKKPPAKKKIVSAACGCPCGSREKAALSASGTAELLPFHFSDRLITPQAESSYSPINRILLPRCIDPPTPPPKIFRS